MIMYLIEDTRALQFYFKNMITEYRIFFLNKLVVILHNYGGQSDILLGPR